MSGDVSVYDLNGEFFRYASEVTVIDLDRSRVARVAHDVTGACRRWKLAKFRPFIEAVAELVVRRVERKGAK